MRVLITEQAEKELLALPKEVRYKFRGYFQILRKDHKLTNKSFRKLTATNLTEFRMKVESGIYRALAGELKSNIIVVLFFKKKSQKTPQKEMRTAINRLNQVNFN